MYSILVWCPLLEDDLALLRQQGYQVERLLRAETMGAPALAAHVRGFDALMVGLDPVTAEMLAGDRLKVVARFGIGVDTVDVEAATEAGVMVTNTPGASKVGVAELAISLMFSLARQLPQHHARTKAGGWQRQLGFELFGKTLGLVGLGQVGKEVARRAVCLGMRVVAHDIAWDQEFSRRYEIERGSLEDVLSQHEEGSHADQYGARESDRRRGPLQRSDLRAPGGCGPGCLCQRAAGRKPAARSRPRHLFSSSGRRDTGILPKLQPHVYGQRPGCSRG